MVFVLIPRENVVINGHEIGENLDHVEGGLKEIFAKVYRTSIRCNEHS